MCTNLPKPVENSDIIFVKSNDSSDTAYPVSYHKVYNENKITFSTKISK